MSILAADFKSQDEKELNAFGKIFQQVVKILQNECHKSWIEIKYQATTETKKGKLQS